MQSEKSFVGAKANDHFGISALRAAHADESLREYSDCQGDWLVPAPKNQWQH